MYNKHLDSFLAVSDAGSFTKAANKLFISPNALIKQINLLESHLGLALFKRTNQGVTLTDSGKSIYRDARRIIQFSNQALQTAHALNSSQKDIIRLGSSLMNPARPIVNLWTSICSKYPHIKIQIIPIDDSKNDKTVFLDDLVDIIAGIFPSTLWKNNCQSLLINKIHLSVAVPINHPLAGRKNLSIFDLYGETLLMVERGDTSFIDILRDDLEINHPQIHIHDMPPYDISTFNYSSISGCPMISADIWADIHPAIVTLPCDWEKDYSVPYGILYSINPSKRVTEFINIIQNSNEEKQMP